MKVLKVILFLFVTNLYAQDILSLKDRSKIIDKIIKERIDNLLPEGFKDEVSNQAGVDHKYTNKI